MKSTLSILIFIFLLSANSFAQKNRDTIVGTIKVKKKEIKVDTVSTKSCECLCNVDQQPSFPGGEKAMLKYFAKTITDEHCQFVKKEKPNYFTVYVGFTIDEEGQVTDVVKTTKNSNQIKKARVSKVVSTPCDDIALEAVRKMPKWNPAMKAGKAAPCKGGILPIKFVLKK